MRHVDLDESYSAHQPQKTALLFCLLNERQIGRQTLDLRACSALRQLPEGLSVGGGLDLSRSSLTQLPKGLRVGGAFDLSSSRIRRLPEDLSVGGALLLRHTVITHLPKGLSVGNERDVSDTGITQLPQRLSVGGGLYLRNIRITQLSQGLSVGGDLNLIYAGITQLPEGPSVSGFLDMRKTYIIQLHGKHLVNIRRKVRAIIKRIYLVFACLHVLHEYLGRARHPDAGAVPRVINRSFSADWADFEDADTEGLSWTPVPESPEKDR